MDTNSHLQIGVVDFVTHYFNGFDHRESHINNILCFFMDASIIDVSHTKNHIAIYLNISFSYFRLNLSIKKILTSNGVDFIDISGDA